MPGAAKRSRGGHVLKRRGSLVGGKKKTRGMVKVPRNRLAFPQSMKTKIR